jgi:hypothetical protein
VAIQHQYIIIQAINVLVGVYGVEREFMNSSVHYVINRLIKEKFHGLLFKVLLLDMITIKPVIKRWVEIRNVTNDKDKIKRD